MRIVNGLRVLSATDLANFLACPHRTGLDMAVAMGKMHPPNAQLDAAVRLLRQRGAAHERAYVDHLRNGGFNIVEIPSDESPAVRVAQTVEALRSGVDVVYQGAFAGQGWVGYADILRKEPCAPGTRTRFGEFQYEPYDMKLARESRGGTVLQLAIYAELLGEVQGLTPERFFVVTPGNPFIEHKYRLADYAAYFRSIRARMLDTLAKGLDALLASGYPEPVEHCDICRWWDRCNAQRRNDDHLSFIAGINRSQRTELVSHGVTTLAGAAALPVPVSFKPSRGARDTYDRIAEQARVQLEQRIRKEPVFEVLPVSDGKGLCRLPKPSPGDLFLDLEGARFVREGGHDYLFGLGHVGTNNEFIYQSWWAMDPIGEQCAFEALVDSIAQSKTIDPNLHIYHFAPYEPTALKRLAGRYATRQDALDDLLRESCFVDLHAVARQAIRAGVESYSIKELEQYYGYCREVSLRDAAVHRIAVEMALEAREPAAIIETTRHTVERYNRDDVRSTLLLRNWLEYLRAAKVEAGQQVPRPMIGPERKNVASDRAERAEALRAQLLIGVSPDASEPDHPQHQRWLLAYLIDWHHREEKAEWWEFFRLRELPEEDLLDEPKALAGLVHVAEVGPFLGKRGKPTGSTIHRYCFPAQEVELTEGDRLQRQDDQPFGEVVALDRVGLTVDVKRSKASGDDHPAAVFSIDVISTRSLQDSVMRFAERLHTAGDEASAGTDLLYCRAPRLRNGVFSLEPGESATDFAVRIVTDLDRTTLAIQGPPGAGKTYVGARMIRAAVARGMRVGVTATSHKVIQNLFDAVQEQANKAGEQLRLARKGKDGEESTPSLAIFKENGAALDAVRTCDVQVLGGTAWLWANEDAGAAVDLLFVDEAGQFSLANTLAIASATDSLILLGDPQQLDQPQKASHPERVELSALAHVLGDNETMPRGRGIFLTETWRLAPEVCSYTSELFYAGKLEPVPALANQQLADATGFGGAGLWWVAVPHDGNRSACDEEVDVIEQLVDRLLAGQWIDQDGVQRPLIPADLRVVAPYNAHVNRLAARLGPRGIPVGTVDKFQGQTCAAVIYSMATSSPDDAPRGMEFLYSPNRLNVATSRGRCASFIVASPALLEPQCRTPRQMHLANGICRYMELARRA